MAKSSAEILAEHRHGGKNTFWIPRRGSIRDQINAADLFVRAARAERIFESGRHLVVGGGVTGVASAIKAAVPGTKLVLIEKADELFPVQAGCDSRFLHPHEYAWPTIPFWPRPSQDSLNSYPFFEEDRVSCPSQLRWTAGAASSVAAEWRLQVELDTPPSLEIRAGVNTIAKNVPDLRVKFDPNGDFGVILACMGALEDTAVDDGGQFASHIYWENDVLENRNLPTLLGRTPLRILISGGGDGGQQDFLRLTCFPPAGLFSAGALFNELLPILIQSEEFRRSVERLLALENPSRPPPHAVWNEHASLVKALAADTALWPQLDARLKSLIDPLVLSGDKDVTMAFEGPTFSAGFSLNSLLVHLVARCLDEHLGGSGRRAPVLKICDGITLIESSTTDHICARIAQECFGKPHTVEFGKSEAEAGEPEEFEFDVIILRHGSDKLALR